MTLYSSGPCAFATSDGRTELVSLGSTSVATDNLMFSLVFGLLIAPVGILWMMFLMRDPAFDAMAVFDLLGRLVMYGRLMAEL
jgi:hypothetical protein